MMTRLRDQARANNILVTQHAQQEMVEESFSLDDVLEAIIDGQVVEDYAQHRRGPCCLLYGLARAGRAVHVVCTTNRPTLIIITVYEPKLPKWITPTQRRHTP